MKLYYAILGGEEYIIPERTARDLKGIVKIETQEMSEETFSFMESVERSEMLTDEEARRLAFKTLLPSL